MADLPICCECTWGDGPDVLVVIERLHGLDRFHDLTADQARALAQQLIDSVNRAEELERGWLDAMLRDEYLAWLEAGGWPSDFNYDGDRGDEFPDCAAQPLDKWAERT